MLSRAGALLRGEHLRRRRQLAHGGRRAEDSVLHSAWQALPVWAKGLMCGN